MANGRSEIAEIEERKGRIPEIAQAEDGNQGDTERVSLRISALHCSGWLWIYILFVLQNYLTDVWGLSFTHAAAILNIWGGLSRILPLFFIFLADEFLGNFAVITLSGLAYPVGMMLLTLSTPPVLANLTGTCKKYETQCVGHTQKVLFYMAMAFLAMAKAAYRACFFDFSEEQNKDKVNWSLLIILRLLVLVFLGFMPVVGIFIFPYIQNWFLLFAISTGFMAFTALLFLSGTFRYSKPKPKGSAITTMWRVFVAASFKISKPFPLDLKKLYHTTEPKYSRSNFLRFLEKAAIVLPSDLSPEGEVNNRWRLCSMEEVKFAKCIFRLGPMLTTFLCCGIVSSIGNTYFVEQGSHMNRKLGNWAVPSQVLLIVFFLGKELFSSLAGVMINRFRKNGPPIGIAVSMMFAALSCTSAAVVETERLKVIRRNGLVEKPGEGIPMSAYWLFFQFFLLAGHDSIFATSVDKLAKTQSSSTLNKYLDFFQVAVTGFGYMFGVLSVYVVGIVSGKVDKRSWIQDTLNKSHLDRYYWFLAVLSSVNLLVFISVAPHYIYGEMKGEQEENEDEA